MTSSVLQKSGDARRDRPPLHYRIPGVIASSGPVSYQEFPVLIPSGATRIGVALRYAGVRQGMLSLEVFDSAGGFRGRRFDPSGSDRAEISLDMGERQASPGALAGPLSEGGWIVEVAGHGLRSAAVFEVLVEVGFHSPERTGRGQARPSHLNPGGIPAVAGRRWFSGDLHVHTEESDGRLSVSDVLEKALVDGLDFIALTDHNNVSSWQKVPRTAVVRGLPLVIRGMEVTTEKGHLNVWGSQGWIDWRVDRRERTVGNVIIDAHQQGGLVSINHPTAPDLPGMHGGWKHPFGMAAADAIEVWNGTRDGHFGLANRDARQIWDNLLNEGKRLTAVGGSDVHFVDGSHVRLGSPRTYVLADALSEERILDGILEGHVCISAGPRLGFTAAVDDGRSRREVNIGDEIEAKGQPVKFAIVVDGIEEPINLRFIRNGRVLLEKGLDRKGPTTLTIVDAPAQQSWYRVELHQVKMPVGVTDSVIALTNPIFVR